MAQTAQTAHTRRNKRKHNGKNGKKPAKYVKGGSDFGPPSFNPEFGGAYYSLNDYKNDLFGMTESTTQHGGTRRNRKTDTKRKKRKNAKPQKRKNAKTQ